MALSLNHYSIRTLDLAACERFYCGLLAWSSGRARAFPFPGLVAVRRRHQRVGQRRACTSSASTATTPRA